MGGAVIERAKTKPECAVMLHWWGGYRRDGGRAKLSSCTYHWRREEAGGGGGKLTWNPGTPPSPCRYLYAELDDIWGAWLSSLTPEPRDSPPALPMQVPVHRAG